MFDFLGITFHADRGFMEEGEMRRPWYLSFQ